MKRTTGTAAHLYKQHFGVFPKGIVVKGLPQGKRQWNMDARKFYDKYVAGNGER